MKFFQVLSLASLALAAPSMEQRDGPGPVNVKLELQGNTEVKASITNSGSTKLRLLKTGSILDKSPVEKAQLFRNSQRVAFDGIHLTIAHEMLGDSAFQSLAAGETVTTTFDAAQLHDLSSGGRFDIQASGVLSYADEGSNRIAGALRYESNRLQADVNGPLAAVAHLKVGAKLLQRTAVQQPDCSGSSLTAIQSSLRSCAQLAQAAAQEAKFGGSRRMLNFFKRDDATTRGVVASTFEKVKGECLSTTSGFSQTYCSDRFNSCSEGVLAYAVAQANYMVYCPLFLNQLPLNAQSCYGQSQANTVVHECTHFNQVKGTSDYGGYGYQFVQSLTPEQNLNHADTYALFAQNVYADCN